MDPDFWHQRWRENQIGFHQPDVNLHLQAFWPQLGVPGGGRVFVPLCGKSLDMRWLRQQGCRVVGVEISPVAVQDFFREQGLQPDCTRTAHFERCSADGIELLCGDFFDLTRADLDGVAAVYDRASLIALPPSLRVDYARHLTGLLAPATPVLLVTLEYDQDQMQGPPFSVTESEVRRLFEAGFEVEVQHADDVLAREPRFRERGLTRLDEKVYLLRRRD